MPADQQAPTARDVLGFIGSPSLLTIYRVSTAVKRTWPTLKSSCAASVDRFISDSEDEAKSQTGLGLLIEEATSKKRKSPPLLANVLCNGRSQE